MHFFLSAIGPDWALSTECSPLSSAFSAQCMHCVWCGLPGRSVFDLSVSGRPGVLEAVLDLGGLEVEGAGDLGGARPVDFFEEQGGGLLEREALGHGQAVRGVGDRVGAVESTTASEGCSVGWPTAFTTACTVVTIAGCRRSSSSR